VAVGTLAPGKSSIGIGIGLGVDPGSGAGGALRAAPNPAFGAVRLDAAGDPAATLEADVLDLLGRTVRHLGPRPGELPWDGLNAQGGRVPAGLYLVRVRRGDRLECARVMLLR